MSNVDFDRSLSKKGVAIKATGYGFLCFLVMPALILCLANPSVLPGMIATLLAFSVPLFLAVIAFADLAAKATMKNKFAAVVYTVSCLFFACIAFSFATYWISASNDGTPSVIDYLGILPLLSFFMVFFGIPACLIISFFYIGMVERLPEFKKIESEQQTRKDHKEISLKN